MTRNSPGSPPTTQEPSLSISRGSFPLPTALHMLPAAAAARARAAEPSRRSLLLAAFAAVALLALAIAGPAQANAPAFGAKRHLIGTGSTGVLTAAHLNDDAYDD